MLARWIFQRLYSTRVLPGPKGYPIVGNMLSVDRDAPYKTFTEWYKQYGPIYYVRMGSVPVVVLCEQELVNLAFSQEIFCGRPPLFVTNGIMDGKGIVTVEGPLWREQRQFTNSCLNHFGYLNPRIDQRIVEGKIIDEVVLMLKKMSKNDGKPYDVHDSVVTAISNLACTVLFGKKFAEDDLYFKRQLELSELGLGLVQVSAVMNYFPFLRFIPYYRRNWATLVGYKKEHFQFLSSIVQDHNISYSDTSPSQAFQGKDFIEVYVRYMKQKLEAYDPKDPETITYFSHPQLLHLLGDLFGASIETLKASTKWSILYLVNNQDVLVKMQNELDTVIGRNRLPTLNDTKNLPYCKAVVREVQRMASVVPLGAPHGATEDGLLEGYKISKGTMIIALLHAIHKNPKVWIEPERFNPDRFLKDNKMKRVTEFMPFSVGRRVCVGSQLAWSFMFLSIASIAHGFDISLVNNVVPSMTPVPGFTLHPQRYSLCFTPRPALSDLLTNSKAIML